MALVLVFEGPLRVKVKLALALDALLLHVADDALVHGLAFAGSDKVQQGWRGGDEDIQPARHFAESERRE